MLNRISQLTKIELMNSEIETHSLDYTYDDYNKHQLLEISPRQIIQNSIQTKRGNKFLYNPVSSAWDAIDYKGYAIASKLNENKYNEQSVRSIYNIQSRLLESLDNELFFCTLPEDSFHQTIANIFSAQRLEKYIIKTGKEAEYPEKVAEVFKVLEERTVESLKMNLIGLSIFDTSIGILGLFENELDYNRIIHFRSQFYGHELMKQMDLKMTRPFIGHITLGYIENKLNEFESRLLANCVNEINETLMHKPFSVNIELTGLRKYENLAAFSREPDFPQHYL